MIHLFTAICCASSAGISLAAGNWQACIMGLVAMLSQINLMNLKARK